MKKIFEGKSEQDREQIQQIVAELLRGSDRTIPTDEVKTFIEHTFNLDFIAFRYDFLFSILIFRTIAEEYDKPNELEVFETDCYKWHFVLRANSQFFERYQRWPSLNNVIVDLRSIFMNIGK